MKLTCTPYVNSQQCFIKLRVKQLDWIISYPTRRFVFRPTRSLIKHCWEENEAIIQKIMIELFVETMSACEYFGVCTQNVVFLSAFFSISYKRQISDIVLYSVFAHFTGIIDVLTTPHGVFNRNNVTLTSSILKRLCKTKWYETIGIRISRLINLFHLSDQWRFCAKCENNHNDLWKRAMTFSVDRAHYQQVPTSSSHIITHCSSDSLKTARDPKA